MTLSRWLVAQLDKIQGVFWLNNGFLFSTEIWPEQLKKHPVEILHSNVLVREVCLDNYLFRQLSDFNAKGKIQTRLEAMES